MWARDIAREGYIRDLADFVEGLLLENSLVLVYGQSNSGKTFFTTTLALCVAAGLPFAGREVDQGAVVYCSLEGSVGFHNRVLAWLNEFRDVDPDIPFLAWRQPLDLADPDALETIAASARLRKAKLVVIDTLNRAMNGADENSSEAMGAVVATLDKLKADTGACILLVHHAGKDLTRGSRGHSCLQAAVDTEIEVKDEGEGFHKATVLKQRDLAKGQEIHFQINPIQVTTNRRGKPVTTCLVDFDVEPLERRASHTERAFEILRELIDAAGKPGFLGAPDGVPSAPDDWWRENFYSRAMHGKKQSAKQQAFKRAAKKLADDGRIRINHGRVWIIQPDIDQT